MDQFGTFDHDNVFIGTVFLTESYYLVVRSQHSYSHKTFNKEVKHNLTQIFWQGFYESINREVAILSVPGSAKANWIEDPAWILQEDLCSVLMRSFPWFFLFDNVKWKEAQISRERPLESWCRQCNGDWGRERKGVWTKKSFLIRTEKAGNTCQISICGKRNRVNWRPLSYGILKVVGGTMAQR